MKATAAMSYSDIDDASSVIVGLFISIALQAFITVHLWAIRADVACDCAQGRDLTALLVIATTTLLLSVILPFMGALGMAITLVLTFAFLGVAVYYLHRVSSCACLHPKSPQHRVFAAIIYIRSAIVLLASLVGLVLFVAAARAAAQVRAMTR